MIPLAQYFADTSGDDFTPFQPATVRKPAQSRRQPEALTVLQPKSLASSPAKSSVRPLKAIVQKPHEAAPRIATEPRVSLREVEAERASWAVERKAQSLALEEAVEAARLDGIEVGRALARNEMEAEQSGRIEEVRLQIANDHGVALASARVEWTEAQADRLADLLILQVAILEETIKLSLTNVLRPLALDTRRQQTLDELVAAVRTIALDGMAYKIAASGPTDLLAALEDRLGDHAKLLSFENDDTQADIRIDADNTVIETRLASWRLALEEALT
ncbi:MAG: hypothetical protein H7Y08_09650 [Rhizobiaceae bacterium]|nr:hypothetical protein [Rhizobiaceae bacterium]